MRISTFFFLTRRGLRNLGKHWAMTFVCILSLSVCMTLNTFATLAEVNVNSMVNYLGQQNEMVVYVDPEADDATIQSVGERITATPGVSRVQYMSKEDVLNQYRGYMADYAVLLDEFENDNPFKANYRVSLADLSQIFDRLAVIFLRVIHAVHVPYTEELLGDLNDRRVHVEGQRVGDVVIGDTAVLELVGDVAAAAGLAHQLVDELAALVVVDSLGAVDDQQFTAAQLVQQQAAHGAVARVGLDGRTVGGGQALVDEPVVGQGVVQLLNEPHTVVLDDDAATAGLLFERGQVLGGQLALILDLGNVHAAEGELGRVVLDLALLADQQQGLVAGVEVGVLHRFLNEFRLAALQLADEEIYGDLFRHRGRPFG